MYAIRLDSAGPDRGFYWDATTQTFSFRKKATTYKKITDLPKILVHKSGCVNSMRLDQEVLAKDDIVYRDVGETTKADVVFINPEI